MSPLPARASRFRLLHAAIIPLAIVAASAPAAAQTLQEVRDAMQMMVSSGAICSDYLERPEILEEIRQTGRYQLGEAGMAEADANALMDEAVAKARAETMTETQKQVACEIVNISALK